jgi:hypothetical protein
MVYAYVSRTNHLFVNLACAAEVTAAAAARKNFLMFDDLSFFCFLK